MKQIIIIVAAAVIGFIAGSFIPHRSDAVIADRDTVRIVKIDTIKIEKPVPEVAYVTNTVRVPVRDTIRIHDTVYMQLPKVVKVYSDSTYKAQISGFHPELDWIEVYPRLETEVVTVARNERKKHFSISVNAGYGLCRDGLSPYFGLGIGYNIVSF